MNIQRMSIHDGPGIRTTVFLKGCPLHCAWCHNPESHRRESELAYHASRCVGCGFCVRQCPAGALALVDGKVQRDASCCVQCDMCVSSCPYGAWECYGKEMSVDEVVSEVLKDKAYYEKSDGGVTFSGGEPLMQAEFVAACAKKLKEEGIHIAVETACFGSVEALKTFHAVTDFFMVDLKTMDEETHKARIKASVQPILQNICLLGEWGAKVLIRIPVVTGCNDSVANMEATAAFLCTHTPFRCVELLKMHKLAQNKYDALQREYAVADVEPPSEETIEALAKVLKAHGISVLYKGEEL